MNNTTLKLALLATLGFASTAIIYAPPVAAASRVSIGVSVGTPIAPPPPRYERVPHARRGYVWAPGYWNWNAHAQRHVWIGGNWVRARPGYRYRPAYWMRHGHGWRFHGGYWRR
ncbi:MAG: hypothetical protein ABI114_02140 [Rhodanobacter sp.]